MDANDIINSLNQILELGDRLDNAGSGVQALSNGKHTTREVCRIELSQFLLYIADASSVINDTQAAVLNIVLGDDYADVPAYKVKELAKTANAPDPARNMTLIAFQHADTVISQQNGGDTASLAELLVNVYEAFGMLMVVANENAIAKSRYDRAISEFKSKISAGASASNRSAASPIRASADDDFVISAGVLTDYKGPGGDVVIPYGVTRIDSDAFTTSIDNITSVKIPESVKNIGEGAFSWCGKLTSIDIPSSVKCIESGAFCYCSELERVRIPASLTDIDDDAFDNCDKLKTVVVYGEKRDEAILDSLKKLFAKRVKVIWEGDKTSRPKTTTTAKKTGTKNRASKKDTSKNVSTSSGKYNDRVSFTLPDGYEFVEGKNDDGDRTVEIKVNPSINDDGETVYESTFLVNIQTPDGMTAEKSALDTIQENNSDSVINKRLAGSPEALVIISSSTSSILGVQITLSLINLALELSADEAIILTCIKPKVGDNEDPIQPTLDQLKTIWESISIDGKKVTAVDMDIEGLSATITETEEADKAKGETPIDNHVLQDGKYLIVGNRWRMEIPYGTRFRVKEHDNFDELLFELDWRIFGHCFLGKTINEQQEAAQATSLMLSINGVSYNELYKTYLRDDEKISVQLVFRIGGSSGTAFEIIVTEKDTCIETRMVVIPPCEIDDLEEAFRKLSEKDMSDGHPFGYEWEQYWKITVRMASSVSPVNETRSSIQLNPAEEIDGGFTVRLPSELRSIKIKDSSKIAYFPTTKRLTQGSLKNPGDYPYSVVLETGKVDDPVPSSDSDPQLPGFQGLMLRTLCSVLERRVKDVFAVELWESVSENGYKAVYLSKNEWGLSPDVFVINKAGCYAVFQFHSESAYDPGKIIHIARTVFDNVHYPNDEEITPIAAPPVQDICHEHYTLMLSGNYTTRRDADFIGQPIRMLMEKCGNQSEEAYDLMQIPNDDYTLDTEARRLAKVFRLDEGLFDPYTDTEAMIRLAMFSDARMFHALRSLAWTVSCMADREGRNLESYGFEELSEMVKLIESMHFNYSTESYCSGLCSHYDWRVFYVPDAYLDSDCESSTDLRTLCGKSQRSGNASFVDMGGLNIFSVMNRTNKIIQRCEETLESLEALRKDLIDLFPVMRTIYDGLMKNRNRSEKLEGVLADALNAWCALAVAAKEPFYSEEATDSPEVDAGLAGPMEQPDDDFENHAPAKRNNTTPKQTGIKRPVRPMPKGEVLDLNGATTIAAGQFNGNMTLRNIIIPEGVTEIGDYAFYSCMALETVVLPKTLKKIGKMAFMSCRALRQVEIPEGVEEIRDHAFGATNNLKEVHLPDSLKIVDRCIFGLGGDSPYATAYMSGELASRLQADKKGSSSSSAIYARRYVIDGVGYENMYDYGKLGTPTPNVLTVAESKTLDEYRAGMEKACKEGKSLQEMIDAGRQAVNENEYGDKDAFEQAIKNLDKSATVTFEGKHFVLSGFGTYEEGVIAEIEKRGGIIHSSMVKMADYLVVCLESPGAVKLKKALEWRQKGASNLIVSDYQMWQAIFGKMDSSSSGEKKSVNKTTTTTSKSKLASQKTTATEKKATPVVESTESAGITKSIPATPEKVENDTDPLKLKRRRIIQKSEFLCKDIKTLIIPEGVTEIRDSAFLFAKLETLELPSTLRIIGEMAFDGCPLRSVTIKEGLESIGSLAFGSNSKLTDIYLPDSIQNVDRRAFSFDAGSLETSYITVHMSGETACRLEKTKKQQSISAIVAKAFIIDGKQYEDIKDYVTAKEREEQLQKEAEERVRQEQARREREEAERKAAEARKQERKKRIQAEIQSLTSEMNSLRGLFAGLKRKKLQARIDELNEQLRRL